MTWPVPFDPSRIDLHTDRVDRADGERQMATVRAILERLERQPGIILADEVGMGKTFVALAAAVSAVWADDRRRPVIVMVPPSLKDKWPRDFQIFRELCLREEDRDLRARSASDGVSLFKLLDDPPKRRAHIIFLTHGALHLNLNDPWTKFAILQHAMWHQKLGKRRQALPRFASRILRIKSRHHTPALFRELLKADARDWRAIIEDHTGHDLGDDPVPKAILRAIEKGRVDLGPLRDELSALPIRKTANFRERITGVRQALNAAFQSIWTEAVVHARFRSPLLILDEAHHLRNPATRLASLFADGEDDARVLSGAFAGRFERMLFLTATPFQLGHHELLRVLDRFDGIHWGKVAPGARETFAKDREALQASLDRAQERAAELDRRWHLLRRSDAGLSADDDEADLDAWWQDVLSRPDAYPPRVQEVRRAFLRALDAKRDAEARLRPWVIRHLRDRQLPGTDAPRRERHCGATILSPGDGPATSGLPVTDSALLPFLLAARSQALVWRAARQHRAARRATFAEGLASSYEAFLETSAGKSDEPLIDEDEPPEAGTDLAQLGHYLKRLQRALPSEAEHAEHPKIAATAQRVRELWREGEKVVVFCHYRATGRALLRHISAALFQEVGGDDRYEALRRFGDAFDRGGPLHAELQQQLAPRLAASALSEDEQSRAFDIIRRFIRTPIFLARYVNPTSDDRRAALRAAFTTRDLSGVTLGDKIEHFVRFLVHRCQDDERADYLHALERLQPGPQFEPANASERGRQIERIPTVRLANGGVKGETRRRLLLGFNTPFFPEILIASSVLAEGVDLHLSCRHILHHDLCWNPSTLEQRTGRVDRLGAKAERAGRPIQIYLPYIGGTQDEKQYRVVTDRERWFQVVMGESYRTDEYSTDKLEDRLPLPDAAASQLASSLSLTGTGAKASPATRLQHSSASS